VSATAARLADGRLHMQHGPIDLIIGVDADAQREIDAAHSAAIARFENILEALVAELALLKSPLGAAYPALQGPVARRMAAAVWPYRAVYITPMAAVAGAVADEILQAMTQRARLRRAYVNNGGDIALHLAPGESFRVGIVANLDHPALDALACIAAGDRVRGLATSGWRGRSFSLGIADAVTIFAADAASADAAATIVANAVNVDHPAIVRRPAVELRDDTDLGTLPVTVDVGALPAKLVADALARGEDKAHELQQCGLIHAALLQLQQQVVMVDSKVRRSGSSLPDDHRSEGPAHQTCPTYATHLLRGIAP